MTFPEDIYTEPEPDPDTLANLGPLRTMAGTWIGTRRARTPTRSSREPKADAYVEHYQLTPIDAQTNGPQLFYGMHYHTRITKPGEVEAFHDQTGYWLWEPATGNIVFTLAIPRGQVAMAGGTAAPDAVHLRGHGARSGTRTSASSRSPFLDYGFHTVSFTMTVTVSVRRRVVVPPGHAPRGARDVRAPSTTRTATPSPAWRPRSPTRWLRRSDAPPPRRPAPTRTVVTMEGGNRPCETTPGTASSLSASCAGSSTSPW